MKKPVFWREAAYLLGLVTLALGAVMLVKADFGLSVVVAPAYLVYRKLSGIWSFLTFGIAEYLVQAILLIALFVLLRRVRVIYLFSFLSALIYGRVLDGFQLLLAPLSMSMLAVRLVFFVIGVLLCAIGVALMFRTYLMPEVYELFIKEMARHHHIPLSKLKTGYDCASCLLAICLSFLFFGLFHFEGVKLGTVFCALVNGKLVGFCGGLMDRVWTFSAAMPKWEAFFLAADEETIIN